MENSCRICLAVNADFPIFDTQVNHENNNRETESIHQKLCMCLHEEITDVLGYPRYICNTCNTTLDLTYNFLKRFKESCEILERSSNHLDNCLDIESDFVNDDEDSKQQIQEENSEVKYNIDVNSENIDEEITKLKQKRLKRNLRCRTQRLEKHTIKTNNIATSLLENAFSWNCRQWSTSQALSQSLEIQNAPLFRLNQMTKISKKKEPSTITKTIKKRELSTKKKKDVLPKTEKKRNPEAKSTSSLCEICGSNFHSASYLSQHIASAHANRSSIPCKDSKCKSVFKTIRSFRSHYKKFHTDIKDCICSECGEQFTYSNDLKRHINRVHDSTKYCPRKYKCRFCDKEGANRAAVLIHERSVHTGERPAVCNVCDASFFHEAYLKEHTRLHTGETPYHCPFCNRGYAQNGNMKSHLRMHKRSEITEEIKAKMRPSYYRLMKP